MNENVYHRLQIRAKSESHFSLSFVATSIRIIIYCQALQYTSTEGLCNSCGIGKALLPILQLICCTFSRQHMLPSNKSIVTGFVLYTSLKELIVVSNQEHCICVCCDTYECKNMEMNVKNF